MRQSKSTARVEKRWVCDHAGCDRRFTRHEHLQRHYQNHTGGDFTCDRCRAHFKRRDLLDRHISRHEAKDAEGSALMTRKRLWKDADGNIVAKKPHLDEPNEIAQPEEHSRHNDAAPLLSPPLSFDITDIQDSDAMNTETIDESLPGFLDHRQMSGLDESISNQNDIFPALSNTAIDDNLFEDAFNPDTGITTMRQVRILIY